MKTTSKARILALLAALAMTLAIWSPIARASATFVTINNDDGGEGLNDPTPRAPVGGNPGTTLGQQRLNAARHAAKIVSASLTSAVPMRIGLWMEPISCGKGWAALAGSGPAYMWRDFAGAPVASTWFAIALANKLYGADLAPARDDLLAAFNSSLDDGSCPDYPRSFYYGLDGKPGPDQHDFVQVALHELVHGLGVGTTVDLTSGAKLEGYDDSYMRNLEDHSRGMRWSAMSDAQRAASAVDTGDLHWTGANVVANAGYLTSGRHSSGHVRMYAPSDLLRGVSVAHFDTVVSPDETMEPVYAGADHNPLKLADELLEDIGWGRVNIVPERADYGGDFQDDIGVFRNGMWFLSHSTDYNGVDLTRAFGSSVPGRDTPDIGEFGCKVNGYPDTQADLVIFRKAASTWQVTLGPDWSSTPDISKTFGTPTHKRLSTRRLDTNGDGCSDLGTFKNGCFEILESPGYGSVTKRVCFGLGTDEPVAGDLNEDGLSDLILWRASSSHFSYRLSPGYSTDRGADLGGGDVPVIGDVNGDGMADLGSYKPATSTFRFTNSPDFSGVDLVRTHGVNGDIPILADVNGDQIADLGVFRKATGRWWFKCSPNWNATCLDKTFGTTGDVPIYGKPAGM